MYAVGQLLAGFAFAVLVGDPAAPKDPPTQLLRDLGNLLLAFTMIWAYLSFSQFLLIWAGNLPEETAYYVPRLYGLGLGRPGAGPAASSPCRFCCCCLKRVKIHQRTGGDRSRRSRCSCTSSI